VAEAKQQLGKTSGVDDAELQTYIDAVTGSMEGYCGAVLARAVTEWHNACGPAIHLDERVASITSVTAYDGATPTTFTEVADPSTVVANSYIRDGQDLVRLDASAFSGRVRVVYQAGIAVVPAELNLACRLIVQTMWRTQNGGAGLPQLSDEPTVTVDGFDMPIPARALFLMNNYERLGGFA
jgi:hypothetical protein